MRNKTAFTILSVTGTGPEPESLVFAHLSAICNCAKPTTHDGRGEAALRKRCDFNWPKNERNKCKVIKPRVELSQNSRNNVSLFLDLHQELNASCSSSGRGRPLNGKGIRGFVYSPLSRILLILPSLVLVLTLLLLRSSAGRSFAHSIASGYKARERSGDERPGHSLCGHCESLSQRKAEGESEDSFTISFHFNDEDDDM